MKKLILLTISLILIFIMVSCGNDKSDKLNPEILLDEDKITVDLTNDSQFWFYVFPGYSLSEAQEECSIPDVTIYYVDTEELNYTNVFLSVTAESPYAVFSGVFEIKYANTDDGFAYRSIHQDVSGTYQVKTYPTESYVRELLYAEGYSYTEIANVSIIPVQDNDQTCEVQIDCIIQHDAHLTEYNSHFELCVFGNGKWQLSYNYFREPIVEYAFDPPTVLETEIAAPINELIPDYIGTFDSSSGVCTFDAEDSTIAYVTDCKLIPSAPDLFDTSNLTIDLTLACRSNSADDYRWDCTDIAINGSVKFFETGTYTITKTSSGETILADIPAELLFSAETLKFAANVTISDTSNRSDSPDGSPILRTMYFGACFNNVTSRAYCLLDERYAIYFDADMKLLDFLYA